MATRVNLCRITKLLSRTEKHAFSNHSGKGCLFKHYGTMATNNCCSQNLIKHTVARSCIFTSFHQPRWSGLGRQCLLSVQHGNKTLVLRCCFHTTGCRRALPPVMWALMATLYKIIAALTGRNIRNRLKEMPSHLRKKYYRYLIAAFASLGLIFGTCASYYYTSHLQEAPISGRKRFITLDKQQCKKIADFELEGLMEQYQDKHLSATHPYYNVVVNTGMRLVQANKDIPGMTDQQWVVHVVDEPEKNAFVLPNGHIFMFTGMIEFCENRDQLAVVLGHEMAHAVLLHAAEQLSYSRFSDKIIIGLMTALWTFMPNDGIAIVFQWYCDKVKKLHVDMPYSRTLEKEADHVGLQFTAKACYDVREGAVLWGRMSIFSDLEGTGKMPEWLSTHPSNETRVKNMNELIPKNLELREKCNCPRLPELDPRQRVQKARNIVNNMMIAKAAKTNVQRVHKGAVS